MPATISNLPKDLLEEIISRVPLKLMRVVRSTCKSWNNLSNSESFRKLHINRVKAREGVMMIASTHHDVSLIRVVADQVDPSLELKGKLSLRNMHGSISRVFHYEGLLLCILRDNKEIVVSNPYLGETRRIKLSYYDSDPGWLFFNYALGYSDKGSCRSMKFLRFLDCSLEVRERQFNRYEIYDFDSGLWTTLDVTPYWIIPFVISRSVSLKGNAYWCANKRSSEKSRVNHIICFDFTRERFGPLLPLPLRDHDYTGVTLSCVTEEKLAALFQHRESFTCGYEIWITTKIETEMVSWSKFLKIGTGPKIYCKGCFIDEEKKVFMAFNEEYNSHGCKPYFNITGGDGKLIKSFHIGDYGVTAEQYRFPDLCFCVPSLVQIKEPTKGKRKRQSRVEKLRFEKERKG